MRFSVKTGLEFHKRKLVFSGTAFQAKPVIGKA
jgi:hypothetical protein